jgi:hypothetical protein
MPLLNHQKREINFKVVYYGPAFSGKTTNLMYLHRHLSPETRGELITMATQTDRTLYFDFMPLDLGEVQGWKMRLSLYTVPGQVQYDVSRKLILNGADAVVFVADSDVLRSPDNMESLQNMVENLAEHRINLDELPWVLQYNKRDLADIMPIERMQKELNARDVPALEAVASEGLGVFATLKSTSKLLLNHIAKVVK